ncbi:hypothetical protein IT402_01015 [Candidatus Nomurabacteria bacterium]|nr:hypothetical protein [Candidatus Nomurabacteria bacterium]
MEKIKKLAVFRNGLAGELGTLIIHENEYAKKKVEVASQRSSIINSVVNKILSQIKNTDVLKALKAITGDKAKTLLYELVEQSIDFDKDEHKSVSLCRSPYLLFGTGEKHSSMEFSKKVNDSAKDFLPIAKITSYPQIGGICFKFEMIGL